MNDRIFDSEFDGALDMLGDMVCIEEITNVGNSFFDCKYFGTRILILAPHPDDEINVAGNMILNLTAAKAEVFVAYSTNGDFENSAEVRASEAVNALKILGVPRQKIIFLGYGDTFNGKGKPHIFFADNKTTTSPAGHSETYAAKSFTDYAKGKHSPYTRENFKRDLKDLLLELRADIIFCVDFDSHSDHRMLSLMFEESLGEILSERSDYRPEVYKKFAYSTAFTSIPDFYAPNLLQTKHPKVGVTDTYDFDLIDRANYAWENRVRFPVPELCRKTLLKGNPLADAIFAHKSQHNEWNSLRILNSDEIFFERRTDNQAFKAKVSATSGDASKVRDFKIIDTDDVDICPSKITNNLWQPDKGDDKKILSFHWVECVQVVRIVVYGNPLDEEKQRIFIRIETVNKRINFDANKISLSNTLEFNAELPEHGRPLILDIEIDNSQPWKSKFLKTVLNCYGRKPFFDEIYPLLEEMLARDFHLLKDLNAATIIAISQYLGITTQIESDNSQYVSMEQQLQNIESDYSPLPYLEKTKPIRKVARVIEMCRQEGADHFLNAIGGQQLYSKEEFAQYNICLNFVQTNPIQYRQDTKLGEFVPNLSIIDVLMNNGREGTKSLLTQYTLV